MKKRKIELIILSLLLTVGLFLAVGVTGGAEGEAAECPSNTEGTSHVLGEDYACTLCGEYEEPSILNQYYQITSASELFWFADQVNSGNGMIMGSLQNDLDLADVPWTPIGTSEHPFEGFFTGSQYTISGMNVEASESGAGFIGYLDSSASTALNSGVINLTVEGKINIVTDVIDNIGGIVGYANATIINECYSYVDISCASDITDISNVGGIAGTVSGESKTLKTSVDSVGYYGRIYLADANDAIGGVIGLADGHSEIKNGVFRGSVISETSGSLGGILGVADSPDVVGPYNCLTLGSVYASESFNGAIAGNLKQYYPDTIKNNYYLDTSSTQGFGMDAGGTAVALPKNSAELKSGEVTYLLNENGINSDWHQWLDSYRPTDYPDLIDGKRVYRLTACDGVGTAYTNNMTKQPHISNNTAECINCGEELFVVIDGVAYYNGGDISTSGLGVDAHIFEGNYKAYFKAGDGYALLTVEDSVIPALDDLSHAITASYEETPVLTLYGATVDLRGTEHSSAFSYKNHLKIAFLGENSIYVDTQSAVKLQGTNPKSITLILSGGDGAVLNVIGPSAYSPEHRTFIAGITVHESGIVNVTGDGSAVEVASLLRVEEGATLSLSEANLMVGMSMSNSLIEADAAPIAVSGKLNAVAEYYEISYEETEEGYITPVNVIYTAYGNAVFPANLLIDLNDPSVNVTESLIINEGAVLTVPEGMKLDLLALASIENRGAVTGDYVCSHVGGVFNCTVGYICDACKTEYTIPIGHQMNPWTWNETEHYRSCYNCTEYEERIPHSYKEYSSANMHFHERDCETCDYTESTEHSFTYEDLGREHKGTCSDCSYEYTEQHYVTTHEYRQIDDEKHEYTCEVCKLNVVETHNFSLFEKVDETYHKKSCYLCEREITAEHTFSFYLPLIPGDCETKGTDRALCDTFCGAEHTKPDEYTGNGHDWDDGEITKAPTCSVKGVRTYYCDNDESHTKTEEIETLEHYYENACDVDCNSCGRLQSIGAHVDADENYLCDECGAEISRGIDVGTVALVTISSAAALGITGFALFWFVIKKKGFRDLFGIFKK